jgi:uncharacterized protein YndB with AHSA1/START domain
VADPGPPVELALTIAARPETIFRFLTDPARFARWMGEGSVLEAEPGGRLRVGFTWGYEGDGQAVPVGSSTVEITLKPEADGTRVRLAAVGPGEAVLASGTNVAGTDLDGRFRWVTGFWDPPRDRPEPPQRP